MTEELRAAAERRRQHTARVDDARSPYYNAIAVHDDGPAFTHMLGVDANKLADAFMDGAVCESTNVGMENARLRTGLELLAKSSHEATREMAQAFLDGRVSRS